MMLGSFFMVTCPYLRELDTIAYFALLRGRHSTAHGRHPGHNPAPAGFTAMRRALRPSLKY
jgi:hypothetical protein